MQINKPSFEMQNQQLPYTIDEDLITNTNINTTSTANTNRSRGIITTSPSSLNLNKKIQSPIKYNISSHTNTIILQKKILMQEQFKLTNKPNINGQMNIIGQANTNGQGSINTQANVNSQATTNVQANANGQANTNNPLGTSLDDGKGILNNVNNFKIQGNNHNNEVVVISPTKQNKSNEKKEVNSMFRISQEYMNIPKDMINNSSNPTNKLNNIDNTSGNKSKNPIKSPSDQLDSILLMNQQSQNRSIINQIMSPKQSPKINQSTTSISKLLGVKKPITKPHQNSLSSNMTNIPMQRATTSPQPGNHGHSNSNTQLGQAQIRASLGSKMNQNNGKNSGNSMEQNPYASPRKGDESSEAKGLDSLAKDILSTKDLNNFNSTPCPKFDESPRMNNIKSNNANANANVNANNKPHKENENIISFGPKANIVQTQIMRFSQSPQLVRIDKSQELKPELFVQQDKSAKKRAFSSMPREDNNSAIDKDRLGGGGIISANHSNHHQSTNITNNNNSNDMNPQEVLLPISPSKIPLKVDQANGTLGIVNPIPNIKAYKPAKWVLTEEEKHSYGDRFPEEYQKIDFLGKGGFALVWLGVHRQTGKKYAIKQMLKNHSTESQRKELKYGRFFFGKNGSPRPELVKYEGVQNIISFVDTKSTRYDVWYIMELGGSTLSKLLFEIKGEFFKGERVYGVKHLEFYRKLHQNSSYLRLLIHDIANVLHLMSDCKIIHSDLKPDNILLDDIAPSLISTESSTSSTSSYDNNSINSTNRRPFKLKIIDFGSAFTYGEQGNIGMATPEYMPPEVLELLSSNNNNSSNKSSIEKLAQICQPWSIDVWSLGCILLEIITGIPLWLSLKCKVDTKGKSNLRVGLFAVKGRGYDKIYAKQRNVIDNLGQTLKEYLPGFKHHELLFDLLTSMLKWDPEKRISPIDMLNHPYLKKND